MKYQVIQGGVMDVQKSRQNGVGGGQNGKKKIARQGAFR
jgi:hypothetical protein